MPDFDAAFDALEHLDDTARRAVELSAAMYEELYLDVETRAHRERQARARLLSSSTHAAEGDMTRLGLRGRTLRELREPSLAPAGSPGRLSRPHARSAEEQEGR